MRGALTVLEVFARLFRLIRLMHPEASLRSVKKHFELLALGIGAMGDIRRWYEIADNPKLAQAMARFPLLSGAIYWPYINRNWSRAARLSAIDRHYRLLDKPASIIERAALEDVELACLGHAYPGLRLVLDKASWFLREGEVVLNLFLQDQRIYSVAFTLGEENGRRLIFVGALQGSNSELAQDTYRSMTHGLHGMRPRDLLMTALKLLCQELGVQTIWAVSGDDRQHNSRYFGDSHKEKVLVAYDEVWLEHGGQALANGFFEIPTAVRRKDGEEIPARKRAMYRRRYQMTDRLADDVRAACARYRELGEREASRDRAGRKYLIISPCRNEADFMRQTLDSVIAQSMKPAKWVIVDDGSTDATPAILAEYAARHDWIEVVTRADRGRRAVGPGVIDAFYAGYERVNADDYEYLCKLDLDLRLPPRYFEVLMQRMEADPRIATCSGKAYIEKDGGLQNERHGDETSIGASKFYRVSKFKAIGGFVREVMWDGIDGHRCRMHGWIACSWDMPELRFIHLRPMGSSQHNIYAGRMRHGFGQYFMGTGLAYMLANAVNRIDERPYLLGSLAMLWGWLSSALQGKPRYGDKAFRAFLRRYQWRALLMGKRRAIEAIYREQGQGIGG